MHDRRLFVAALLATALGGLHHAIVGTLSPRLITELGDPDLYVLVAGAYLSATVVGAAAAVPLARRYPGPRLLWLALVTLVGGLFLALASTAMWMLVLARALAGAGAGLAFVAALGLARRGSGRAGWLAAAVGAGFVLGPVVGSAVTELIGWRWIFSASLAVAIVAAAMVRTSPSIDPGEDLADLRVARREVPAFAALALSAAATFVGLLFLPVAAESGPGGGWLGSAIVAVPLAIGVVAGAGAAPRIAGGWPAALGPALLAAGLVGRAAVGPDRTLGAVVAVVVGVGAGLTLAGLAGVGRSAALQVAVRQAAGVAGLAAAGAVMLTGMRDQLLLNLRPIVDAVLADVPDNLRDIGRALADQALRTLGDNLTAANLADTGRGFAAIVLEQIPAEFQPMAEPYREALDAAFTDALRTGLAGAFLLGAALAGAALVAALAARLPGRSSAGPRP